MKNRIKELRQIKELTQAELANRLGVSQGAIQKLESGVVDLDLKWMSSISKALGTQPYELLPQGGNLQKCLKVICSFCKL